MIAFQITMTVRESQREAFESRFAACFLPAVSRQEGFREALLLEPYEHLRGDQSVASPTVPDTPGTDTTEYQLQLRFDSEQQRRRWVDSDDHDPAWGTLRELAEQVSVQGYRSIPAQQVTS
jgi:heme-degrading monooxygenase HmoA